MLLHELDSDDASEDERHNCKTTYTTDGYVFTTLVTVGFIRAIAAVEALW